MERTFLQLVRLGIGHSTGVFPDNVDWNKIQDIANAQGLGAVVLDGLEQLRNHQKSVKLPGKIVLAQWIGDVLHEYEYRYEQYCKAIGKLAGFYNKHGFKMMILKGYACSLDWPKPEHRPCGDIDIWLFGQYKDADDILRKKGVEIDNSHHHHTVFNWHSYTVENHYDFISIHHHKSHVALEKIFKELGQDDSHFVELNGEQIYMPSANLHALFLIKHAVLHFCSTELTIRQILDWAFFVEKHSKEINWDWLKDVIDKHGMMPFFIIVNGICVEDLGFSRSLFPTISFNTILKEKVLNEILSSVYQGDGASNIIMRQVHRFQRWHENAWKHKLCYKESMWSAFWSGVWSHILKPSSI